jgi:pimeloyl-ACP methyl ester carboxylesterase
MSTRPLRTPPLARDRAAALVLLTVAAALGCDDAPPPATTDGGSRPVDMAPAPRDAGGATPDVALPPGDTAPPPPASPDAAAGPDGSAPTEGGAAAASDPTAGIAVAAIAWGPCPDDMDPDQTDVDDCARLPVPLDYSKPDGEKIEILVGRVRAKDPARRIGSLFANPGGPGEPGVTDGFLSSLADNLSPEIQARFDLVSWDPRGVPASAAVDCMAMPSLIEIDRGHDLSPTTTQKEVLTAAYRTWVDSCKAKSKLLPFVSTAATVSDLEILRRAVGDAKLTYLGFSYGTSIGAHYLLRYPERVRALVLDGVDSVWADAVEETDQDVAFEAALNAFFEWCGRASEQDCPFARENPDRAAAYDALVAAIKANPVPAPRFPGQVVTANLLPWSVAFYLYAEGAWPYLGAALERARMGVGNRLFEAAELFQGPPGPGQDPFIAILCGDTDPLTAAQVDAYAQKVARSRIALPYGRMSCVGWPVSNLTPQPGPVPAAIPPVVLIGSTGDPATPYKWATTAAARLPGSTLITAVAYDHTYYGYGAPCIDGPVDAYLLEGKVPPAGIRCEFPDPVMVPEPNPTDSGLQALARQRPWRRPPPRR